MSSGGASVSFRGVWWDANEDAELERLHKVWEGLDKKGRRDFGDWCDGKIRGRSGLAAYEHFRVLHPTPEPRTRRRWSPDEDKALLRLRTQWEALDKKGQFATWVDGKISGRSGDAANGRFKNHFEDGGKARGGGAPKAAPAPVNGTSSKPKARIAVGGDGAAPKRRKGGAPEPALLAPPLAPALLAPPPAAANASSGLNDAALATATGKTIADLESRLGAATEQLAAATGTIADLGAQLGEANEALAQAEGERAQADEALAQAAEERASAADQCAQAAESRASDATARALAAEAQLRDLQTAAAAAEAELQERTAAARTAPGGGGSSSHKREAPPSPKRARESATEDETRPPGWCPTCQACHFAGDPSTVLLECGHSFCQRALNAWQADSGGLCLCLCPQC